MQEEVELPGAYWLVAIADGQPVLTPPSETFYERVAGDDDLAQGWRPAADPRSPVRMRPDERFGLPAVGGIKTEIIWEHLAADETFGDVAEQFDLTVDEVHWALAHETSLQAARNRPTFGSTSTPTYSAWPTSSPGYAPTSPTQVILEPSSTGELDRRV